MITCSHWWRRRLRLLWLRLLTRYLPLATSPVLPVSAPTARCPPLPFSCCHKIWVVAQLLTFTFLCFRPPLGGNVRLFILSARPSCLVRSSWSIISCQLPHYWLLTGAGWRRSHVNETRRSFWDYRFLDNRLCDHQPPARAGPCRTAECWQLSTTDGAGGPSLLSIYWLCKYCCSPAPCHFDMVQIYHKHSCDSIHVFCRGHYQVSLVWHFMKPGKIRIYLHPNIGQHNVCFKS